MTGFSQESEIDRLRTHRQEVLGDVIDGISGPLENPANAANTADRPKTAPLPGGGRLSRA